MIVSVDHGNKSVKTPNFLFTSGVIVSEDKPALNVDYIFWDGKYYTLTEKRISYLRDKTKDDRFYVLTLFAIALAAPPHAGFMQLLVQLITLFTG